MTKSGQKFIKTVPAPRLVGVHPNPGPGGGPEWTEEEKWRIIVMWKYEHKSPRTIAKELHHDRRNIRNLIEKYQETGTRKKEKIDEADSETDAKES